jgi:signal peptide peptidase SppA
MSKKPHALDRVLALALQPWAITPEMLHTLAHVLSHRLAGAATDAAAFERREPAAHEQRDTVAIIPVHGVIAPRMNLFSEISGGATFEGAGAALEEAVQRPDVSTILLDIDSPGGSVAGASEFARQVLAARTKKRIIAHAHYQMCSAAYWFGACATEVVAAPSAVAGSIGVYTVHEDLSKMLDELGVKVTYVAAGKFKVDGNETEPLSDTARARMHALVESNYQRFVADVALGRGRTVEAVTNGFGQGTVLTADECLAAGMIDRIATFEDTLARVLPSHAVPLSAAVPPARLAPVTSQEPSPATDQERARQRREAQRALLSLGL